MRQIMGIKVSCFATLCAFMFVSTQSFAGTEPNKVDNTITPTVTHHIFENAKKNENWKLAFLTGKNAQVVFMTITPKTNPNNEIGMETHKFDQIIFIAEGNAKTVLNGKSSIVKSGDLIFIPQGTAHNVINLNANKPLKIISVYSNTDIPANSAFKKKSDEPKE